jgi:hypothetical protein
MRCCAEREDCPEVCRWPTGKWPTNRADAIPEAPDETWSAVDAALRDGGRGLRGGSSLARLLSRHRGKRNHRDSPSGRY